MKIEQLIKFAKDIKVIFVIYISLGYCSNYMKAIEIEASKDAKSYFQEFE